MPVPRFSVLVYCAAETVAVAEMPELERWVLHRLAELDKVVREGYAAYDFQGVFRAVFEFATVDLSAFYFDIRKDVLYCDLGPAVPLDEMDFGEIR